MAASPLRPTMLVAMLILAGCAAVAVDPYRPTPAAMQQPHPEAVPHTDHKGAVMLRYDPQRSFLPRALGGALVDYRLGVRRGFASAFAADFNAVAADPEQPLDALLRAAEGSGVALLRPREETAAATPHPVLLDAAPAVVVNVARDPARIDAFAAIVKAHPRQPVWAMLPAAGKPGQPMPNPAQARALAFAALVHGASGLIWLGEDNYAARNAGAIGIAAAPQLDYGIGTADPPPRSSVAKPYIATPKEVAAAKRLWDSIARLNRVLIRLTPALLQPDARRPYSVAVAASDRDASDRDASGRDATGRDAMAAPVRTLLRPWEGRELVLIAVNLENRSHALRIAFAQPLHHVARLPAGGRLGVDREAVDADAAAGTIRDRIEPYGVRLYRLVP
ncbi:MAG TPA: hypothetical protein VF194_08270 [Ferrovibrio sp.]|uniref:hypothetical protein n=1 Tax=Ferrovibrio sp. TaxID=1917215 RepID=UPI002ED33A90